MNILLIICDIISILFWLFIYLYLIGAIVATYRIEKSLNEYYKEKGHSFSDDLARKKREGKQ